MFVYMLALARQTAGPNGLTFFREPLITSAKKHFFLLKIEIPRATPGISASYMSIRFNLGLIKG